jgi:hypothetical protein
MIRFFFSLVSGFLALQAVSASAANLRDVEVNRSGTIDERIRDGDLTAK